VRTHISDAVVAAAELDMAKWWTATPQSFFEHVRKTVIIEAIMEVNPKLDRAALDQAPKKEVLARAKRTFKNSKGLPAPLRGGGGEAGGNPQREPFRSAARIEAMPASPAPRHPAESQVRGAVKLVRPNSLHTRPQVRCLRPGFGVATPWPHPSKAKPRRPSISCRAPPTMPMKTYPYGHQGCARDEIPLPILQSLTNTQSMTAGLDIPMATMTIRNIDDTLKARLRVRAATHGKSMEDEARDILRAALSAETPNAVDLGQAIHARFAPLGGVELPELLRELITEPTDFSK
jgi:plasmid stability protein